MPKLNGKPSGQKKTHGHPRRDAEPKPKPPTEKKLGPDGKEKRGKWGKKPKPEADSDDSGYDEAPVASDGEEDGFGFDLTSSLAGTSTMSRFKPTRPVSVASKSKAASNGKASVMEISDEEEESEEVDEDEDAEIMAMMGKKSLKDGASAVKAVMGKGKGKEAKTMVGGGSWQSMGKSPLELHVDRILNALVRQAWRLNCYVRYSSEGTRHRHQFNVLRSPTPSLNHHETSSVWPEPVPEKP